MFSFCFSEVLDPSRTEGVPLIVSAAGEALYWRSDAFDDFAMHKPQLSKCNKNGRRKRGAKEIGPSNYAKKARVEGEDEDCEDEDEEEVDAEEEEQREGGIDEQDDEEA